MAERVKVQTLVHCAAPSIRVALSRLRNIVRHANFDHAYPIVYVLDDLEGSVDAGGFGEGFHEGMVPLMAVDYLENILISTWVSAVYGAPAGQSRLQPSVNPLSTLRWHSLTA